MTGAEQIPNFRTERFVLILRRDPLRPDHSGERAPLLEPLSEPPRGKGELIVMKPLLRMAIVSILAALFMCSSPTLGRPRGENRICREQYRAAMRAARGLPRGERRLAKERARRDLYQCRDHH